MKSPPSLHLEPRRSFRALALPAAMHAATAMLLLALPLPFGLRIAGPAVVAVAGALAVWRSAGRNAPASLHVGFNGRIAVTRRDGRVEEGAVLADSYVGRRLTTIVWRPEGAYRARSLLILADTFPVDDFRRLRVVLRYGRALDAASGTSGVDAGRPISHA
jgi:hypothetical protein